MHGAPDPCRLRYLVAHNTTLECSRRWAGGARVRNKAMRDGILVKFKGLCEIAKEEKL